MQIEPKYSWESLPVYEWNNQFARVIGRLLASTPSRFHIYSHNLAGQATVMSNAIAGGHKDAAPGEVVPVEQRRAYFMIGITAASMAEGILNDLARVTKAARRDVAEGLSLVRKIRDQFESDLTALDAVPAEVKVYLA